MFEDMTVREQAMDFPTLYRLKLELRDELEPSDD